MQASVITNDLGRFGAASRQNALKRQLTLPNPADGHGAHFVRLNMPRWLRSCVGGDEDGFLLMMIDPSRHEWDGFRGMWQGWVTKSASFNEWGSEKDDGQHKLCNHRNNASA